MRRLVHKLAKDLYERCIDTSTGHVYYYNPRTGRYVSSSDAVATMQ